MDNVFISASPLTIKLRLFDPRMNFALFGLLSFLSVFNVFFSERLMMLSYISKDDTDKKEDGPNDRA
jgi:hypothetical protein